MGVHDQRGRRPSNLVASLVSALVVGFSGALASPAQAQDTAEEAPKVQKIRAVERGWFLESDVGFAVIVNKIRNRRFGLMPDIGLAIGYDILPILNISLGMNMMAAPAGPSEEFPNRADLLLLVPKLNVRFAVLTTERNFLWVQASAGLGIGRPSQISGQDYGTFSPIIGATVGFERFTKLRHFSIGARLGVLVMPGLVKKPDGPDTGGNFGIAISFVPTLKYTF